MQNIWQQSQITVIACVSETGHAIPPYVIFDTKGMNYERMKGEVPGTQYSLSESGWVDTELFKRWLLKHLLKHAVVGRPLLLVLDGHSTHYQHETIKFAHDNGVAMMHVYHLILCMKVIPLMLVYLSH